MNNSIKSLQKRAYDNSLRHGFHGKGNEKGFGDVIALIHSELSEAYEEYRHHHDFAETYYENGDKPCGIPSYYSYLLLYKTFILGYFLYHPL